MRFMPPPDALRPTVSSVSVFRPASRSPARGDRGLPHDPHDSDTTPTAAHTGRSLPG